MVELIVTPYCLEDFDKLTQADSYLVGNEGFGVRLAASFPLETFEACVSKAHNLGKKLYVNVNKVFTSDEIAGLINFLQYLKSCEVDGIFFSDFGVYNIAQRLEMVDLLVYYSETQMVNYLDADFIRSLGVKSLILSKDITLENIQEFAAHCTYDIGLPIYGYYPLFYSKRQLIRNYFAQYKRDSSRYNKNNQLTLKEQQRNESYPIYQDENGTNIFSGEILLGIDYLQNFITLGYSKFIIDGIFENIDYLVEIVNLFASARKTSCQYASMLKAKYPNKNYGTAFYYKQIGVSN